MPDQRNHRHDQQGVDQSAGDVKHDPAEDPADQEYEKEREKHGDLVNVRKAAARRNPAINRRLTPLRYSLWASRVVDGVPAAASPADEMCSAPVRFSTSFARAISSE